MPHREIKKPKANKGQTIGAPSAQDTVDTSFDYPIFCFRHLDGTFGMNNCDHDERSALVSQLTRLSQLSWNDIKLSHKHGMGTEKINKSAIRSTFPVFISDDVDHLLAFRFKGLAPFLGHRNGSVLHIIYIDSKFTLYDHGS